MRSLSIAFLFTLFATGPVFGAKAASVATSTSESVIISTDYGLGIIYGATNGPDNHAADVDDAYAVSLALQNRSVAAIVTTFGNDKAQPSAESARRGLAALNVEGAPSYVVVGSEGFLDATPVTFEPPGLAVPFYCVNEGVKRMSKDLHDRAIKTVTLFVIGPFTDVACLRRAYPESFNRVKEIIALAGSFTGKPKLYGSDVVDFNYAMDPTAAGEVVAQSDVPLTMIMFEVSQLGTLKDKLLITWSTQGTGSQKYYGRASIPHAKYWDTIFSQTNGQPLWDAHTVYYYLNPSAYICNPKMYATAIVGGYPNTDAATTQNFLSVSFLPADTPNTASGARTYGGVVRGCYGFSEPGGQQAFEDAVSDSVKPVSNR